MTNADTSSSTLICCALPIILVTLGLGAVSATLFETLPFLVTLTRYKSWMFLGSAGMLAIGGWALYRPGRYCPTDPVLAAKCNAAHRWNKRIWWASVVMTNMLSSSCNNCSSCCLVLISSSRSLAIALTSALDLSLSS